MRVARVAVPLALLFWQMAPAPPSDEPPRGGPFRVALAYATGEWEDATFGCGGGVQSSTAVPARSGGAKVEFVGEGPLRLTASAGRWQIDHSTGRLSKTFAGFQVALEDEDFGFGAGYVSHPYSKADRTGFANFYIRFGSRRNEHFIAEVNPPSETPAMMGTVRMGVGIGNRMERRTSGFVGVAWGPFGQKMGQGVLLADVGIPVSRSFDLLVRGSAGLGAKTPQWAVGGGLRAVW
jgi:hypothetical protein